MEVVKVPPASKVFHMMFTQSSPNKPTKLRHLWAPVKIFRGGNFPKRCRILTLRPLDIRIWPAPGHFFRDCKVFQVASNWLFDM